MRRVLFSFNLATYKSYYNINRYSVKKQKQIAPSRRAFQIMYGLCVSAELVRISNNNREIAITLQLWMSN